jgi:hypothetical protein
MSLLLTIRAWQSHLTILLPPETLFQLQILANNHEFSLAYNLPDSIRAIAGSIVAAQIESLSHALSQRTDLPIARYRFNNSITQWAANPSPSRHPIWRLCLFPVFLGLTRLPAVSEIFTGIVEYASSITFEPVTNATVPNASYPPNEEISVRFYSRTALLPQILFPLAHLSVSRILWFHETNVRRRHEQICHWGPSFLV